MGTKTTCQLYCTQPIQLWWLVKAALQRRRAIQR